MTLEIKKQESYSRAELILRTFFGPFYLALPHLFLLFFVSIWVSITNVILFFVILFTGKNPLNYFELKLKFFRWLLRVNARLSNYSDGYPAFGLDPDDENVTLKIDYKENYSRVKLLLIAFFGWLYVGIPHLFLLYFRIIATFLLSFLAFFAVLFTGKYPQEFFEFNVGTTRWFYRVNLYLNFMTEKYPPFSGKSDEELGLLTMGKN